MIATLKLTCFWNLIALLAALRFSGAAKNDTITNNPNDEHKKPGDVATFICPFKGDTQPTWIRSDKDGTTRGIYNPRQVVENTYTVTYGDPTGDPLNGVAVATLTIVAVVELNESQYHCYLNNAEVPQPTSAKATLFVYGAPNPPKFDMIPGYNYLLVDWYAPWLPTAVSGIVLLNYELELQAEDGTVIETATESADSALKHTFHDVMSNTSYKVRMRAKNSIGLSEWSALTEKTTPLPEAPGKPFNLKTSVNINGGTPAISVSWEDPDRNLFEQPPITVYTLYYKKGEEEEVSLAGSSTPASVPSPELGVEYTVTVSATNDGGESEKSDEIKTTVKYLISAAVEVVDQKLNITCSVEITDVSVKCSVTAVEKDPMTNFKKEEDMMTGATQSEVNFMMAIAPGTYDVTIQIVNDDSAPLEDFKFTKSDVVIDTVTTTVPIPTSTTSVVHTSPTPTSRVPPTIPSLSQVEIGIAAGVIGAFLLAVVMVPMFILTMAVCCMSKKSSFLL